MKKIITMNQLMEGETAIIIKDDKQKIFSRFVDLGITRGTKIKCVKRNKGIGAYLIRGCVIAIRDEDCKDFFVETGENYE